MTDAEKLISILDVIMQCPKCRLSSRVGDCEPDVDGDGSLGCPACGGVVAEKEASHANP